MCCFFGVFLFIFLFAGWTTGDDMDLSFDLGLDTLLSKVDMDMMTDPDPAHKALPKAPRLMAWHMALPKAP